MELIHSHKGKFDGLRCWNQYESDMTVILYALRRAKDYGFSKVQIISNALEVVKVINGDEGWSIKNLLVAQVSLFLLVLVIYLESLMGMLATLLFSFYHDEKFVDWKFSSLVYWVGLTIPCCFNALYTNYYLGI